MLDIKYIREHTAEVKENAKNRGAKVDIEKLLKLDKERSRLLVTRDGLKNTKNTISEEIGLELVKQQLGTVGEPTSKKVKDKRAELVHKSKEADTQITNIEAELDKLETEYRELWFAVPNLTHPDVVVSTNEDDNPVPETVGKVPKFTFTPKDHVELSETLDLVDFDRATKITGSKFYYLKNELALMEFALIQYALEIAVKHGFTPFSTPDLAKREVLAGLGFNPRGDSTQVYNIEDTDLSLIGTAEITMGGYHMNEVLDESELPKKYVAVSHCFRTEAGSYSKYSKGLFRVHQFTKVEMFQYVTPENAEKAHAEILNIEKEIFSGLDIPYRVVDHCTADLGTPAIRTFDLEAWMPGKPNKDGSLGDWGEITSASNCTDFQSRALNIKYTDKDGKKDFVYMLNGTATAIGRTLIAILENNQQADGSIVIPKVLQKWVGKEVIK